MEIAFICQQTMRLAHFNTRQLKAPVTVLRWWLSLQHSVQMSETLRPHNVFVTFPVKHRVQRVFHNECWSSYMPVICPTLRILRFRKGHCYTECPFQIIVAFVEIKFNKVCGICILRDESSYWQRGTETGWYKYEFEFKPDGMSWISVYG